MAHCSEIELALDMQSPPKPRKPRVRTHTGADGVKLEVYEGDVPESENLGIPGAARAAFLRAEEMAADRRAGAHALASEIADSDPAGEMLAPMHETLDEKHPAAVDVPASEAPSMKLTDRDGLLKETLDAVGRARMAQGRANNKFNRGEIAENMKTKSIEAEDVNADGEAMLPEHLGHAQRAFARLMGFDALHAAGFDTAGMPNLNQFMGEYFGGKDAEKRRNKLRRDITKRQKRRAGSD